MRKETRHLLYELLVFFKEPEYRAKGLDTDIGVKIALALEEQIQHEEEFSDDRENAMAAASKRLDKKVLRAETMKNARNATQKVVAAMESYMEEKERDGRCLWDDAWASPATQKRKCIEALDGGMEELQQVTKKFKERLVEEALRKKTLRPKPSSSAEPGLFD